MRQRDQRSISGREPDHSHACHRLHLLHSRGSRRLLSLHTLSIYPDLYCDRIIPLNKVYNQHRCPHLRDVVECSPKLPGNAQRLALRD
eukprot:SAG31_NODE_43808_length_265_cov_0.933735_1_plen_87_part_11